MSKYNHLDSLVNQLIEDEDFEPDERDMIRKALKRLNHALDIKNIKEIRVSIDNLSEKLLK
jgi:hypothetical protein